MANQQLRITTACLAVNLLILFVADAAMVAADRPNRVTSSDVAAGRWMDSLLDPSLPSASRRPANRQRPKRSMAQRQRSNVRGKLVRNSDVQDGSPPFALVDRYGGVLRYIEPVKSVDLRQHLGKTVGVRHDTGDILLASQLALPRNGRARAANGVQLAQNIEPIPADGPITEGESLPAGEIIGDSTPIESYDNGPVYIDGGYDEGLNFGGCSNCGDILCGDPACGRRGGGCGFGARGVMYAHAEYLLWHLDGMEIPPLVTQVPFDTTTFTPNGPATTLYGGNSVLEDERHGGRITLGLWLDDYGQWGIEGDYLWLAEIDERFSAGTKDQNFPQDGAFIFRPFFNTGIIGGDLTTRGRSLEDVDTNDLDGTVTTEVYSEFRTAGLRLRHNLCCREGCSTGCGDCVGCGSGVACGGGVGCGSGVVGPIGPLNRLCNLLRNGTRHHDVLYGVRWASLNEGLNVTEDLQQIIVGTAPPQAVTLGNQIDVFDRFSTENEFFGGELGYETEWKLNRWSLNLLSKLAIGNTRQRVNISGATIIDDELGTVITSNDGGLLTQRYAHPDGFTVGNIGTYERDVFSVMPEIGFTLGYNLTRRLKLTGGYTLLYWSNVVRPGDQVDLDVNANLLRRDGVPDPTTIVNDDHPRFEFRQTDLWAQGLNFGAEYTW